MPGLTATFYVGTSLDALYAPLPERPVGDGSVIDGAAAPGTFTQGYYWDGAMAGEEVYVQLRVWANASSYEEARRTGQLIGRSKILKITTRSELDGPATLDDIGNITLFEPGSFNPAVFANPGKVGEPWRITGFPGTYLIQSSDLVSPWTPIATIESADGSVEFIDTRTNKPDAAFYRAILVD